MRSRKYWTVRDSVLPPHNNVRWLCPPEWGYSDLATVLVIGATCPFEARMTLSQLGSRKTP